MKHKTPPTTRAYTLVLTAALLAGCGGASPEKLTASAEAYLAKGDTRAAVIELKTALQQQPSSAQARFLLGKAFLASAEPALAEIELRKALELKQPTESVAPLLARALLDLGKHKDLIDQFGDTTLSDKQAQASLKTTLGWAYARSGRGPEAEAAFRQALDAVPSFVPAQVALARQQAGRGDLDVAGKTVDALISSGKADADAWTLKGDLLGINQRDREGALAAYRKALAIDKAHAGAHLSIITQQLAAGDAKAAGDQVAELLKVSPGNAMGRYFQAVVAYGNRDFKSAKELVQQLLRGAPDSPQLNQLAGAIELAGGSAEQARAYLGKTLQAAPGSVTARNLLASAHLKSGEPAKALALLEPLLEPSSQNAQALMLAGEAHMQTRELDKASEYFARATKANPKSVGSRAALARTRFLRGDTAGAVAELEQIAANDTGTVADLELVNEQLRRRDFKQALKAIDNLERKVPGKSTPMNLRGLAYLGLGDSVQARASFEKALSLDPAFFPAAFSLAALDIADKKPQQAQQRFEAIIKAQPGHLRAMQALAELRARNGASEQEVTEILADAVRLNPNQASAHVSLINNHLIGKRYPQALTSAQQALAALPDNLVILDALGRAQAAAGQYAQAINTFNKILAVQPGNLQAHMRIADVNLAAKNIDAAGQSLRRAVAQAPNSPLAHQRLFALELNAGRTAEALKLARELQKSQPAHSMGFIQEGDALRAQKKDDAALSAYKAALGKANPEAAAPRFHATLTALRRSAEAEKFAAGWTQDHPKDVPFLTYVGSAALVRQDWTSAEVAFRRIVELQPNNAVALNNVAWLMLKAGKPGALALAEKANSLAPDQPGVMNTLAEALAHDKQLDKAVELQKRVVVLAPDNLAMQLALARLHLQAGQKAEARAILESLGKLGEKFASHAEVKALLTGL